MFRKALVTLVSLLSGSAAMAQVTPRPDVLTGAFQPGFVGEADDKRYPVRVVALGAVDLPSGRVVLADPFIVSDRDKPLTLSFPPGRYPVELAVADAGESGQRVALARLKLSDAPTVKWSMALAEGQDLASLKGDEIFGFGVDSGTGGFIDPQVLSWISKTYPPSRFEAYETLTDDWQTRGEAAAEPLGIPYGFALIETVGPGGMAMFSSGWGDGHYASWIGYDAEGKPTAIVTDFAVITAVNIPGP
jgi:hypothetical protein